MLDNSIPLIAMVSGHLVTSWPLISARYPEAVKIAIWGMRGDCIIHGKILVCITDGVSWPSSEAIVGASAWQS
jgi:hypothetical protein